MFQIIPTIGTILALAAFFFAVYFRTVQKYAQIGLDSVKSIGELPSKSRLDATKVLVNVFDLDIKSLSPDQQFQPALKTFEKRERDSKRNFLLLLSGGVVLLIFAGGYGLAKMDGAAMVRAALFADSISASAELNKQGYFRTTDSRLVENLARVAAVDRSITDPFERSQKFATELSKQPTVLELRQRAESDKAPFEVTGEILTVSNPKRADQPPRYIAYVRRQSALAGRIITVRAKGRSTYIRLFAKGVVDVDSPADLQLNFEQFVEVFGEKANELRNALVTPSSEETVFDPTCPRYQGFSVIACDLPESVSTDKIPARLN